MRCLPLPQPEEPFANAKTYAFQEAANEASSGVQGDVLASSGSRPKQEEVSAVKTCSERVETRNIVRHAFVLLELNWRPSADC